MGFTFVDDSNCFTAARTELAFKSLPGVATRGSKLELEVYPIVDPSSERIASSDLVFKESCLIWCIWKVSSLKGPGSTVVTASDDTILLSVQTSLFIDLLLGKTVDCSFSGLCS